MNIQDLKQDFKFHFDSTKPLYRQLYEYLERCIVSGILKEGDQMIPETHICEAFKVSRSTVRKTMDMLLEEGLIMRRRGKGSFVAAQRMKRSINYLYNFTENIQNIGSVPSSIVLEAKVLNDAPKEVLEKLHLQKHDKVFYLNRIRCANEIPLLNEKTYIPYALCPLIEQYDFTSKSLYDVLSNQYKLNLYHATESIEAVVMSVKEKQLLQCKDNIPGFKIKRISHMDDGRVFEYTTSLTRADRCIFEMELYKKATQFSPVEIKRSVLLQDR